MATDEVKIHPIAIYLKIWALLFILSAGSYAVDYFHLEGYLRWSLIVLFMMLKAGLIVSFFMHMIWERLAMMYAIIIPPVLVMVFMGIMIFESGDTFANRSIFLVFGGS